MEKFVDLLQGLLDSPEVQSQLMPGATADQRRMVLACGVLQALGLMSEVMATKCVAEYAADTIKPHREGERVEALHLAQCLLLSSAPDLVLSTMLVASIEEGGLNTRILSSSIDETLENAPELIAGMMAGAATKAIIVAGLVQPVDLVSSILDNFAKKQNGPHH